MKIRWKPHELCVWHRAPPESTTQQLPLLLPPHGQYKHRLQTGKKYFHHLNSTRCVSLALCCHIHANKCSPATADKVTRLAPYQDSANYHWLPQHSYSLLKMHPFRMVHAWSCVKNYIHPLSDTDTAGQHADLTHKHRREQNVNVSQDFWTKNCCSVRMWSCMNQFYSSAVWTSIP